MAGARPMPADARASPHLPEQTQAYSDSPRSIGGTQRERAESRIRHACGIKVRKPGRVTDVVTLGPKIESYPLVDLEVLK